MTCATCPKPLMPSEHARGNVRCRACRAAKKGQVMRQIVKPKPAKPRANGIALLTRAMRQQPQERRESFWTTAPRANWMAQVEQHRFAPVPYGPLLVSWTTE